METLRARTQEGLQDGWIREDTAFPSAAQRCAAWLYRPAVPKAGSPIVVMAHGFGAPRYARLDVTASRLAQAGFPVLLFDYRHIGDSEGRPRQLVDVPRQLEDWRAAIAHARSLAFVDPDRVALFGTSFGGGHVLATAAGDARLAAVVAQTPFVDGRARNPYRPRGVALAGLLVAALLDRLFGGLGLPPVYIPICAAPGRVGVLTSPDALDGFRMLDVKAEGINKAAARVVFQVVGYRPGLRAREIACPVLYVLCLEDMVTPFGAAERTAEATPDAEVVTVHGGHFDVYATDGGPVFEQAMAAESAFLQRRLRP